MSGFDGLDMQVRELQDRLAAANAEIEQLRAELAATTAKLATVHEYADYAASKWRNHVPAFSFDDWYAANHATEAQP